MPIPTLPTAPSRGSAPDVFATAADAWVAALPAWTTAANATAAQVDADATAAAASETAAAASATAAISVSASTKWVSGTTYAQGDVRWSPTTFQSYRRKVAGAGTTDPYLDATNWAAIATVPDQAGNAGKVLGTDGTVASWLDPKLLVVAYASRATLRAMTPVAGNQVLLEGVGIFQWVSGSVVEDDDETAFNTASGSWELVATGPDWVELLVTAEVEDLRDEMVDQFVGVSRVLRASFAMALTSVAASTASTAGTVNVPGARIGDAVVVATPATVGTTSADQAALDIKAFVSSADTVTVLLTNSTAATANLSAATWAVSVFK